jgi:glycosyltransferase involved in cell wall biosynthesis
MIPKTAEAGNVCGISQVQVRQRKMTYVLNHYSESDVTHFAHVMRLLEELAARGIQIRVLIEKADSVPSFQSPHIHARVLRRKGAQRYLNLMLELWRAIRDGYATIFVRISSRAALLAVVASRLRGGKVFYWLSGTTLAHDREQPWSATKLRWLLASRVPALLVQRFCDFLVTGPEAMVDYYATQAGVDRRRIRLLYNDIDLTRFRRSAENAASAAALRRTLEIAPDTLALLFVHRLSPVRRSLFYLPYIAAELCANPATPKFTCIIVGAGPELPALRDAVTAAHLSHVFKLLGDVPNARIQQLYWAADIFIQASYNEGFPRVLLEAMAAGLPIVTTDAGGTRDILAAAQREFVVPRDERDALVRKLSILMADATQRTALAHENLLTVERFATPRIAEMYDSVLFQQ